MPTHVFDLSPQSFAEWASERQLPRFLPGQVLRWVYERGVIDPQQMTDLSKAARELLAREMVFLRGDIQARQIASDGTQKLLLAWDQPRRPAPSPEPAGTPATPGEEAADGRHSGAIALPQPPRDDAEARRRSTECVMIPTETRRTACVSSQVGCPVGCAFCASGIGGLEGNLASGQIVEQVWRLGRLPDVERITNVVFMGMGEPLANFSAVTEAIRVLNAPWGLGISARRITVSTVGLPQAIRRLCTFEIPVTLALSLHAPNDEIRRQIIPWAEYATIDELLDACDEWFGKTGREITLEYILLGGVNDRPQHARELARVARRIRANVNLIRYNEVRALPFDRPATEDVRRFQEVLRQQGVAPHIRRSRGRDIAAACGQLRYEGEGGE